MELSPIEKMQLKNQVERVLHVPGNYNGGILEMAVVLDYDLPVEVLKEKSKEILQTLKTQSEIFRNVRLNVVKWVSDECFIKEVSAIPMVLMGKVFEDYESIKNTASDQSTKESGQKTLDELTRQLQLFYARSKLVLVITDGNYRIFDSSAVKKYMHPFLHRKLLFLQTKEIISGTKLLLQLNS